MFFVAGDYTWTQLFVEALRQGAVVLAPFALAVAVTRWTAWNQAL